MPRFLRSAVLPLCLLLVGATALLLVQSRQEAVERAREITERTAPADWFYGQRAFPGVEVPQEKFQAALEQVMSERALASPEFGTSSATLTWQPVGPYNIGGRVTALASTPGGTTVFLGSANGGVFKSIDSGVSWAPMTDRYSFYSIGALAIHPGEPDVVYCGTGEANSSVDSYDGNGLWRSSDGGASWRSLGLAATGRIAAVAIDPNNTNHLLVAAMGRQFSTGAERGLYRSLDRGQTWTKTLFVNDSTGVCDVVFNPQHPETVFAATWERVRRYTYRRAFGPGCAVWRSINGGATWTRLAGGLPGPSENVGRIALAIAPSQPRTVYAQVITGAISGYIGQGLYRTTDGGDTWVRRDVGSTFRNSFGSFGWYFGELAVSPANPDEIWTGGVQILKSNDGGVSYLDVTGASHVDQHAMWIDPSEPTRMYLGNDGGFYSALGGGWEKSFDLPITQFYAGSVDKNNALKVLGGTQDNNTLKTESGPSDWNAILGGDGFYCMTDPTNTNIVFAEWQFCCDRSGIRRSTTNGSGFTTVSGFVNTDRYNWNTPIAMSPANHNLMLVGSHRVYMSTNNGVNFSPVSGDLTTNPGAATVFGTISTLDVSGVNDSVFYAGTDDGRVWRSVNKGAAWTNISAGLPLRSITRVAADRFNSQVVYVTLSGFGQDEPIAHVYRSDDRGNTWQSIAGNLPDAPANDIVVDGLDPNTLYLGTDLGVFITRNLGATWWGLGAGMPLQTIFDLEYHAGSRQLFAFTHGRSIHKLDLNALPVSVPAATVAPRLALSAPSPNPARGPVHFSLELDRDAALEVTVYGVDGRRVRTLVREISSAGRRWIVWDGMDERGSAAQPGVYFTRASAAGATRTQRLVLTR